MRSKLIILFSIIFVQVYSQEVYTNSHDDIYIRDSIFYRKNDDTVFTGTVEFKRNNGKISNKEEYQNGYLIKETEFYNKVEPLPYLETYYYSKSFFQVEKDVYKHVTGEIYKIEYYNINGGKRLVEHYQFQQKMYSCEYLNGKKNGVEICITKNGNEQITHYKNGKKLK